MYILCSPFEAENDDYDDVTVTVTVRDENNNAPIFTRDHFIGGKFAIHVPSLRMSTPRFSYSKSNLVRHSALRRLCEIHAQENARTTVL